MIAAGSAGDVEKRVVEAYRALADRCDVVVCEGSDFTGSAPGLDFDLNARLANALGCPVLAVVKAASASDAAPAVQVARESLEARGCELFGLIVSRVPPEATDEVADAVGRQDGERPVYVLPEQPELANPSVGDVAAELGAETLFGAAARAAARGSRRAGRRHERRALHRRPRGRHARDRPGRPRRHPGGLPGREPVADAPRRGRHRAHRRLRARPHGPQAPRARARSRCWRFRTAPTRWPPGSTRSSRS